MDWVIVAATVVIAFSAAVSLGVTWRLSQDSRALRKAGTEPEVVAYLALDATSPSVINLVLENVGQGPACDVDFFVDADAEDFSEHSVRFVTARSRQAIALLPQGQRIERMMGPGWDLMKEEDPLPPFWVEVSYENLRGVRSESQPFKLDVSEFGGSLAGWPADERSAESLERIERHLGQLARDVSFVRLDAVARRRAAKDDSGASQKEAAAATDGNAAS
ncbi:MAG: hypothetical protein OXI51_08535 [Chloroflexota bacterium]|nr:hypothetical protein [Chloroflexota bacterium]